MHQCRRQLEAEGIHAAVVNCRFVKPLDVELLCSIAAAARRVITVEENVLMGGFGSAVSECLDKQGLAHVPVHRIALPETFVLHGKRDALLRQCGLDTDGIFANVREFVRTSQRQLL